MQAQIESHAHRMTAWQPAVRTPCRQEQHPYGDTEPISPIKFTENLPCTASLRATGPKSEDRAMPWASSNAL